ncbi:MAG: HAD family phosphatase [Chloroflexota bacterium]|nr:MAG: HAD family phosphatase [Chloroflexota bacterium]
MTQHEITGNAPDRAVLWDLDGVIVDTAPLHLWSWQKAFGEIGVPFSESDFKRGFGQRTSEIIRQVLGPNVDQRQLDALTERKEAYFRSVAAAGVDALPGARDLVMALRAAGWAQSIASSAPLENVDLLLNALSIRNYMEAVVAARDVSVGKPAPDVFLVAAARVGVEPARCVVIEDAIAGVEAAKAAGMKCVAVTNTHSADHLARADLVVDSLEQLAAEDFARLLSQR